MSLKIQNVEEMEKEEKYQEMMLSQEEVIWITYIRKVEDPEIRESLISMLRFCALPKLKE